MKFLVDENVGFSIINFLRENGFDTKSVSELYPSRDDIFIFNEAQRENRIIVTNDKDFGYLVFKTEPPPISVILLRFEDESIPGKLNAIKEILKLPKEKLLEHFIVLSENKIRIRSLKPNKD